jgi:hypothetical protein
MFLTIVAALIFVFWVFPFLVGLFGPILIGLLVIFYDIVVAVLQNLKKFFNITRIY